jgi:hypothetical protein
VASRQVSTFGLALLPRGLRRCCCGSGWLQLPLHPQPPLSLAPTLVLVCWLGLLRAATPSLPAGRLLAPSLVDHRSILAGLLLILSSFRALDCTLLLHRLVCHPRLRGRLRGVGFGGLAKASSDLCRGLLLPGETDVGGVSQNSDKIPEHVRERENSELV